MHATSLPPLHRRALCTMGIGTDHVAALVRCNGGYRRKDGAGGVFTTRTVNAMHRAWLVELSDDFPPVATLTRKGRVLAAQLLAGEPAKAGAA